MAPAVTLNRYRPRDLTWRSHAKNRRVGWRGLHE